MIITQNMPFKRPALIALIILSSLYSINAQDSKKLIDARLERDRTKFGLTARDVSDYLITDQYTDRETGLTHTYIQQRYNKIIVYNAISVFLINHYRFKI